MCSSRWVTLILVRQTQSLHREGWIHRNFSNNLHDNEQVLKFTLNNVCSSRIIFSMKNKRHTYVTRRFLTCNVLKESAFIHEMNYLIKVCTFLPLIFMTGVHPPSPHPKFPMWQKTDNGWESTRRVTTPLTLDLLNQNEKKKEIQQVMKTMMVK